MSDTTLFLNPQPIPPGRFGPTDPTPWRALATGILVATSLGAVAKRTGDERLGGIAALMDQDLCPPPRRVPPIPPSPPEPPGPPPWVYLGLATELLALASVMPESATRDALLGRAQDIVGFAASPQRFG